MASRRGWSYSTSGSGRIGRHAYRRRGGLAALPFGLGAIVPILAAIVLIALVSWYHFAFGGVIVRGLIVDRTAGAPIANAYIWSNAGGASTDADGRFALDNVKPPELIQAVASGHRPTSVRIWPGSASITVQLDEDTGAVAAASVTEVARTQATVTVGATPVARAVAIASPSPTVDPNPLRPLLPEHRIVAYYGNPLASQMGILGELAPADMLKKLEAQAAQYQAADRTRTVLPALELVTPAAQSDAGEDATYRARMRPDLIEQVAGWADSAHALLILDVQIGRSSVPEEVNVLLPYLRRPNVHLALDPEFAMPPGKVPGAVVGTMDAATVNGAISTLSQLVRENNLPPKILIIHRFTDDMVTHSADIHPDPNVQVIITMDGFGNPALKLAQYEEYVHRQGVQFAGIKLFYHHDVPLLTPDVLVDLEPFPDLVIYQ
ncbi:MAG: lipoprotein [Chloroflexota bacterium]